MGSGQKIYFLNFGKKLLGTKKGFRVHRLVTSKLFIDFGSFHNKKRKKIGWQNFFGPGVNIMT